MLQWTFQAQCRIMSASTWQDWGVLIILWAKVSADNLQVNQIKF